VDPVPDPLLLRKSGSAGNNPDLWVSSQELRPLDHRGGPHTHTHTHTPHMTHIVSGSSQRASVAS
jgi:hypothetical protein